MPLTCALIITALILQMVVSPEQTTRLRNSLLFDTADISEFYWEPPDYPPTFKLGTLDPPAQLKAQLDNIVADPQQGTGNFEHALAIGRFLAVENFNSAIIQSNVLTSLDSIVHRGEGYCADFTQVYNGLAQGMSIPVREWGMSFDGFSGDGHAFNEIYDHVLDRWIFIDSYFSFYVRDRVSRQPLSVLDFRERLETETTRESIEVVPISEKRFLFGSKSMAIDYYRRGMTELYLWWGNNVFEYDESHAVSLAGQVSRSLQEAIAILTGIHPEIRILKSPKNEKAIAELERLKAKFLVLVSAGLLTYGLLFAQALTAMRNRRRASQRNDVGPESLSSRYS